MLLGPNDLFISNDSIRSNISCGVAGFRKNVF